MIPPLIITLAIIISLLLVPYIIGNLMHKMYPLFKSSKDHGVIWLSGLCWTLILYTVILLLYMMGQALELIIK
jgi:predicted Na+-dependent transporter